MDNLQVTSISANAKYWYLPLITGILFVILGIWVFRTPLTSYLTLAFLFAITFLITGLIEIVYAISNRKQTDNWGWSLAIGVIDFLIGVLLVSQPQMSLIILPFYVGFGILFRSIMAIGWSVFIKNQKIEGWGILLFVGILGIIFAFILLWNPVFAGMTIVFYTGLAFIIIGILQIYLAIQLRKIKISAG